MSLRVVLTGATGFLGRHTLPVLEQHYGRDNVKGLSSKDYDLMKPDDVQALFRDLKPDVVVHFAAYSGGIGANRSFPADFYYRNTLLTALMFEAAAQHRVQKLVYAMGGCSYPAKATSPIGEDQLWQGYPQDESAGYSTAKMMGTVASRSYRTQHGLNSVVMIPGNMYGEYDNFRTQESHVVPAMIRRYYEAMLEGKEEVAMWGTGAPQRDFVYAGDVARLVPTFIDHYHSSEPVNCSSGTTTSIKDLAGMIAHYAGYKGRIAWDATKPDGQMVKIFATDRLKAMGLLCDTPMDEGLKRTLAWFAQNYAQASDGLRL